MGMFRDTPKGVIIHGSRSGLDGTEMDEFQRTVNWARNHTHGLAWNATIGPDVVAIHLEAGEWGWNARAHSWEWLAVEFSQARMGDPVSDAQVRAFAWWFLNRARKRWPELPAEFPMHAELSAGKVDGKTDLYPAGPEADAFRERIGDYLKTLVVPGV